MTRADFEKAFKVKSVAKMREAAKDYEPEWSYLALAVQRGPIERVQALLDLGMKPTQETLERAAGKGRVAVMELLVASGVAVDGRGDGGTTALHYAAMAGHLEAVEWLLARGARVDAKSGRGNTPLTLAVKERAVDVARRLVAAGATVDADAQKGLAKLGITAEGGSKPPDPDLELRGRLVGEWKLTGIRYAGGKPRKPSSSKAGLSLAADGTFAGTSELGRPTQGTWRVEGPQALVVAQFGTPTPIELDDAGRVLIEKLDEEHGRRYHEIYARR